MPGHLQQLEDPLDPGASLLADGQDAGELPRRGHELGDVRREGEEGAQADPPVQCQPAAQGEHRNLSEHRDRLQQRLEARLQAHRAHPRAVELLSGVDHPLQLALLLTEGLHHPHPGDVLVDDPGDLALPLLAVPAGREDLRAHPVGDEEERRRDHQSDQCEQRREHQHDHQRDQHHQQVAAHQRDEVEQPLHQRRVAAGPGDQLARGHLRQRLLVHPDQPVVHRIAQVVLDLEGHLPAEVPPQVGQPEGHQRDRDQEHQPRPQPGGGMADHLVDDVPGHQGRQCLPATAQQRGTEREVQRSSVHQHRADQLAQPPGLSLVAHGIDRTRCVGALRCRACQSTPNSPDFSSSWPPRRR